MFFKKEKKVIELILKHLDLAVDSLKSGIQTIAFYLNGDIGNAKRLAVATFLNRTAAGQLRMIIERHSSSRYSDHIAITRD